MLWILYGLTTLLIDAHKEKKPLKNVRQYSDAEWNQMTQEQRDEAIKRMMYEGKMEILRNIK